jgi:V/A-type H+-transporting ATPase subunit E
LTAKILEDAKKRAAEITSEAQAKAAAILGEATDDANRESGRVAAEAVNEAARAAEQVVLSKTLSVRDQNLDAKQQTLDKVFAKALEELNALPEEQYKAFLFSWLEELDPDGGEIILPKNRDITVDEINSRLQAAGKKGNLSPDADSRGIKGGFILSKDGIEQNNTFEALVDYYRYELESEVLKALY